MKNTEKIPQQVLDNLLELSDKMPQLECDGFSIITSFVLYRHGIPHNREYGYLSWISPDGVDRELMHFWVVLEEGSVLLDFRAKMWAGDIAPHGIVKLPHSNFKYEVDGTDLGVVTNPRIPQILGLEGDLLNLALRTDEQTKPA